MTCPACAAPAGSIVRVSASHHRSYMDGCESIVQTRSIGASMTAIGQVARNFELDANFFSAVRHHWRTDMIDLYPTMQRRFTPEAQEPRLPRVFRRGCSVDGE